MLRLRNLLKPRRTAFDVARELVQGLDDGSIVLSSETVKNQISFDTEPVISRVMPGTVVIGSSVNSVFAQEDGLIGSLYSGAESWNEWRARNHYVRLNLSGLTLTRARLKGVDFSDVDFSNEELADQSITSLSSWNSTDFSGADLSSANFQRANLSGVILQSADLSNADLSEAKLVGANLRGADLSNADLTGANLTFADLNNVKLRNSKVAGAIFKATRGLTNYEEIELRFRGAIFDDAFGKGADLYTKR